ncbi:hypothetical protein QWZ04_22830 [Vibrio tapetis subsp. quintayensis]|uniref:hypothetical protein n=1 Tax=Vibrio tapetis TaxID=52443 RepID=UPI0025B4C9C9|nr:hypothetical protein [Vibrio tapetis]MDN3683147.1 hypothetical protein [Vibrio tapetis subsp. quintayensis]
MHKSILPRTVNHLISSLIAMYLIILPPVLCIERGYWWLWLGVSALLWGVITWLDSLSLDFTLTKTQINGWRFVIAALMTYILIVFPIEQFIGLMLAGGTLLLSADLDESHEQPDERSRASN